MGRYRDDTYDDVLDETPEQIEARWERSARARDEHDRRLGRVISDSGDGDTLTNKGWELA